MLAHRWWSPDATVFRAPARLRGAGCGVFTPRCCAAGVSPARPGGAAALWLARAGRR